MFQTNKMITMPTLKDREIHQVPVNNFNVWNSNAKQQYLLNMKGNILAYLFMMLGLSSKIMYTFNKYLA